MFDQNALLYLYIHSHRKMWKGVSQMAQQVKAFTSRPDSLSFGPWSAYDGRRGSISAHYLVTSTHMQYKVHPSP